VNRKRHFFEGKLTELWIDFNDSKHINRKNHPGDCDLIRFYISRAGKKKMDNCFLKNSVSKKIPIPDIRDRE
jgi:hypothetical protein